jgi:hypothetical protein
MFLLHQWIAAGIISAAARFIPVPFVDDIVRGQCRRFVVSRTLSSHNDPVSIDELKPYYGKSGGCLTGCAAAVAKAPLKLLLFPIRKVMAVMTSVRGVPLEILRMVLLGRTLDRYLREGKITTAATATHDVAARMRAAFNEAFARMDFHVVRATVGDALRGASGWKAAAVASAKQLGDRQAAPDADLETDPQLEAGASRVAEVLSRPETLELFAEFDRRFDDAFDRLA